MTKKTTSLLTLAAVMVAAILSGCSRATESQTTESQVSKPSNASSTPSVTTNAANAPSQADALTPSAVINPSEQANGKKSKPTANAPEPKIGSGGNDFSIFTEIRSQLGTDNELSTAVILNVKEGVVTLTGNVSSPAQKAKAEQIVRRVEGVKNLKNNLRVAS